MSGNLLRPLPIRHANALKVSAEVGRLIKEILKMANSGRSGTLFLRNDLRISVSYDERSSSRNQKGAKTPQVVITTWTGSRFFLWRNRQGKISQDRINCIPAGDDAYIVGSQFGTMLRFCQGLGESSVQVCLPTT